MIDSKDSRNTYGFKSVDETMSHLLKPLFNHDKKKFIIINNLVKNWTQIVGKKFDKYCFPKAVIFEKNSKSIKLTIAVYNSAVGFFLENNSELIIERIASLYGFKSVSKIIIKQEPKQIKIKDNSEIKLSEYKENIIKKFTDNFDDKDLKAVIEKLGKEVFKNVAK